MATKTVKEISESTGISRFTVHSAATDGPLKGVSRQSGRTWLIDTESKEYKEWLRKHDEQPRVKGRAAK